MSTGKSDCKYLWQLPVFIYLEYNLFNCLRSKEMKALLV